MGDVSRRPESYEFVIPHSSFVICSALALLVRRVLLANDPHNAVPFHDATRVAAPFHRSRNLHRPLPTTVLTPFAPSPIVVDYPVNGVSRRRTAARLIVRRSAHARYHGAITRPAPGHRARGGPGRGASGYPHGPAPRVHRAGQRGRARSVTAGQFAPRRLPQPHPARAPASPIVSRERDARQVKTCRLARPPQANSIPHRDVVASTLLRVLQN